MIISQPRKTKKNGLIFYSVTVEDNSQKKDLWYSVDECYEEPRFQIITATFMGRCRRGSQLLKVVRSSRQRNKRYYHELSTVDRGKKISDF
ncbi:hypothetical protein AB4403_04615, partial [Vibrio breoganii]